MSLVWLIGTTGVVSVWVGAQHQVEKHLFCARLLNIGPLMRRSGKCMEWEKQKGVPVICRPVQAGEGCLGADMSWHVCPLSFFFPSSVWLYLLMNWEFLLSFLPLLPPLCFFLSFSVMPSFYPSVLLLRSLAPSSLFSSALDVTALPSLSCLPIICDQCCVRAHTSAQTANRWCVNACVCVCVCMYLHPIWYTED